jgi:ubiquinone/menaquinone biosynthesis C-methylase UbiE
MDEAEFDKFAKEYKELHQGVIGASGESVEFFAEYKVRDTVACIKEHALPPNLSILDFGSGIGGSVPYFLKYLPQCQLTCLDVSRKSLDIGTGRFKGKARFIHFDGQQIPLDDNSFHAVFTACVFHHIPHDAHEKLLKEIRRILKPGGIFIAFEHNPNNFLTVRVVNACPFDENAVLIRGKNFRRLLQKTGFKQDILRYRLFFPGPLRALRPLERFMTWIPFGAQYYVSAQKSA